MGTPDPQGNQEGLSEPPTPGETGGCRWQADSDGGKIDEELNENWDCLGRKE